MFKTIRSQLLALAVFSAVISVLIGLIGWYANSRITEDLSIAVGDGVAMRNHMQADMLHEGVKGAVEAYKGAVADNSPERVTTAKEELTRMAKEIRVEFAKNDNAPTLGDTITKEINRVKTSVNTYAASAEKMLSIAPTDNVELEKGRADVSKQFTVLEKDLALVRDAIENKLVASRTQAEADTNFFRYVLIGTIFIGALLVLGAVLLVFRSVTGKLAQMNGALVKLNAGDYTARVNLKSNDELGQVSNAFDKLLDDRLEALAQGARENEQLNNSVVDIIQSVAQVAGSKDLSIRVPVTEDVTGAIGDAMNMLTSETAKVMGKVTDVSNDVSSATTSLKLSSDAAMTAATTGQAEVEAAALELSKTSNTLNQMSIVAQKANESAEAAVRTTRQALATVDKTVSGITESRDLIRETEKRIKRLGERSQEISQAVGLINSIAERTGLLALNASMQATVAGEAGRGFALVAEEVKRLSENAREATREISTLVSAIQSETSETVLAMNNAITQIVDTSRLADQAGNEMKGTQQATEDLAGNVRAIAATSIEQAQAGQSLQVRSIAIQTASRETSRQLTTQAKDTEKLVEAASALLREVSVFKLPRR
ncbi:MAG: methyl-accepting chemotaxis protein [Polaromonas sp.]